MGGRQTLPHVNRNELIKQENIPRGNDDALDVPDDQYLCPLCERVPEILNVHTDNGHIELKCKYHGIIDLTIQDYFRKMKNSLFTYYKTSCYNCKNTQDNKQNMFKYCCYCKVDLCQTCVNKFDLKDKDHRAHHLDVCIPVNEKPHRCLEHLNADINTFCVDCEENVCDKETTKKHSGHNKINLFKFAPEIEKYKKSIIDKNKTLSDIIRFNQLILNTYENFQYNYYHIQSLINVGKSLEEENKRDAKEIECMISGLEKTHKAQKEAIKSLQEKFAIDLDGNEIKLSLRDRNLGDEGLKLISKIQFKRLKDIDVSKNNIQNIEPLNNMNLPHLEYINMSENQISNIKPIAELNSKKLKEIWLQENNIQNFDDLLKSEFPELVRLRIEGNNFSEDLQDIKKLLSKYGKKVIHKARTFDEFKKKYKCNIDEEEEGKGISLNLSGLNAGDDILEELYLILKPDNKITELNLHNNELKDVSLLSRIPLKKLQLLDLSLNHINNVKFLPEMRCKRLKYIYLNDNLLKDITPLIKIYDPDLNRHDDENLIDEDDEEAKKKENFPSLKVISLKNNYLANEDKQSEKVLKLLKDKDIAVDNRIDPDHKNK